MTNRKQKIIGAVGPNVTGITCSINGVVAPNRRETLRGIKRNRASWILAACMCAESCLTLCDPVGCSPPGFSVHGIFQARTLERAAI